MKKLSLDQMGNLEGGITPKQRKVMWGVCTAAAVGSAFGPIGLAIFGPTALGCIVFGGVDAFGNSASPLPGSGSGLPDMRVPTFPSGGSSLPRI